jgi:hypothetical protein
MENTKNTAKYLIIAIISIIALMISLFLFINKSSSPGIEQYRSVPTARQDSLEFLSRNFKMGLEVDGHHFDTILVQDRNELKSLFHLIQEPVLIFRFFHTNCHPCIEKCFHLMQEECSDLNNKPIIIAYFPEYRSLRNYCKNNKIENPYYLSVKDGIDWHPDSYGSEYFFVLYPNGKASHFFAIKEGYEEHTKLYLKGINRLLSTN